MVVFEPGPFCTLPYRNITDSPFDSVFDDLELAKTASDAVNDFTRAQLREDGFYRRILPAIAVENDEITMVPSDIRQQLSDNAIKDFLAEEDSRIISNLSALVGGKR